MGCVDSPISCGGGLAFQHNDGGSISFKSLAAEKTYRLSIIVEILQHFIKFMPDTLLDLQVMCKINGCKLIYGTSKKQRTKRSRLYASRIRA
jgi:hypothetical protein